MKQLIKNLGTWLFDARPQGLGTLLVGIAACVALYRSADLLDRVLEIRQQTGLINQAVAELKTQSTRIETAVGLLEQRVIEVVSEKALNELAKKGSSPSAADIYQVLKAIPQTPADDQHGSVFLSPDQRDLTVDKLLHAKEPLEKKLILQEALKYGSPRG